MRKIEVRNGATYFEQVPIAAAKKMAQVEIALPLMVTSCAICNRPIDLKHCKTNEDGNAVHELCYITMMSGVKNPN